MPSPAIHRLLPWLASLTLALPAAASAQPVGATLAVLDEYAQIDGVSAPLRRVLSAAFLRRSPPGDPRTD